jgi:NAD(P)-dependent dehydrogenase (short-subunit alcohol dehydrogenase family)
MNTGLVGKRVLVTGASGGIGSARARAFAEEGRLVLHYNRGREQVEALASELDDAVVAQADLTREDDIERLFTESREATFRGLNACAAVAGVWPEEDVPLWQLPLERVAGGMEGRLLHTS